MEYNIDNAELTATLTAVNLDTAVVGQAPLEVAIGESARIDVGTAINYVKSGAAEIAAAVQEGTAAFDLNAEQKTADFNFNVSNKTAEYNQNADNRLSEYNANDVAKTVVYNQNASDKTDAFNTNAENQFDDYNANVSNKLNAYNDNASDKLIAFDNNAATKTQAYNDNATAKTTAFDGNYSDKLSAFNNNASAKTQAFDNNATAKTTAFNENAAIKQAAVDASADAAAASASAASADATTAKKYAIGVPSEPSGYSAKYWAEQTAQSLSGLQSDVADIQAVIPTGATASNKLTDKSYVDTAYNNLQSQIDAITASSDVTDIVGTYAELQSYDTSTLPPNSIIKVLQDESRNNETTYYRWVIIGGVGAWSLIGEEGPYYTISAADAKFATQTALSTGLSGKQDTIRDLAAIRSGAELGATAVQPSNLATVATSGSYNDLINKPTIPAAQVNADWNATSGVARILNKPTIPTVPTNVSAFTNDAGYITSSALTGYATQTWVGQQGFITGITSSDVTTALGYTPYNASNPSGYITSAALENYVTTDSAQTITGTKTFTRDVAAKINYTRGIAPASSVYPKPFIIYDANGNIFACIQLTFLASKSARAELLVYNGADADDVTPASMVVVNDNGSKYATAPASDVVNSIVTTVNKSKATNGYVQLGNGVIINWGRTTVQTSSQTATVTFSKAYSSNYAAHVALQAGGSDMPKVSSINSTSFILSRQPTSASASPATYTWIAVGY